METVLVSACLLGVHCRYDGAAKPDRARIDRLAQQGRHLVPVCPEQLGGLPTPRAPAEITNGDGTTVLAGAARVVNTDGVDVTEQYVRGAEEVLRLAKRLGCRRAVLKEKSPACGVRTVKRGDETRPGIGVAAALLKREGLDLEGV